MVLRFWPWCCFWSTSWLRCSGLSLWSLLCGCGVGRCGDCRCVSKSLACAFAFVRFRTVWFAAPPLSGRAHRSPSFRFLVFRLSALFGCLSGGSSCRLLSRFGVPLAWTSSGPLGVSLQSVGFAAWTGVTG